MYYLGERILKNKKISFENISFYGNSNGRNCLLGPNKEKMAIFSLKITVFSPKSSIMTFITLCMSSFIRYPEIFLCFIS
jgi:hypothetical protein